MGEGPFVSRALGLCHALTIQGFKSAKNPKIGCFGTIPELFHVKHRNTYFEIRHTKYEIRCIVIRNTLPLS